MVKIDRGDVRVRKVGPKRCECGRGNVTHAVWIDLRNNGTNVVAVTGCKRCADEHAARLKESLPEISPGG